MEPTDFIIILLLMLCLSTWFATLFAKCPSPSPLPPPQIIYKYRPELDLQFDTKNFPSKVYNDVFNGNNLSPGGYNLLNTGRITQTNTNKKTK